MDISSISNASYSRSVTESRSGSDRKYNDQNQATVEQNSTRDKLRESTQQQRTAQDAIEQSKQENQRRLDGRLVSFGQAEGEISEQSQSSYNRSRVNEAYSPPPNNALTETHKQQSAETDIDAIDIVV